MDQKLSREQESRLTSAEKIAGKGVMPLDDSALEAVSGGQTLSGVTSVYQCLLCGWTCATNNNDMRELAFSHIMEGPDPECVGKFAYYQF